MHRLPLRRQIFAFASMCIGTFIALLDIQIVSASLRDIGGGLSAGVDETVWVQTSYLIAEIIVIPMSGWLSRVFSTRWLFAISAAGFTLSSLLCGAAWNIQSMIVFRALQGFLGGSMIPTVFTTAFVFFDGKQRVIAAASLEVSRELFETNYFGMAQVSRAFTPILAANEGGAIVNVLSVVSWIGSTMLAPYAATKAAAWSFTNSLRLQLREQGTQVVGLHVGFMDTDLVRDLQAPKIPPNVVAQRTFDALEAGKDEVLADDMTYKVKQGLTADPAIYLVPLTR